MKKNLVAASFLFFCGSLFAQTSSFEKTENVKANKYQVETNLFGSNWFVSVGGGAQIYFGDHDRQMSIGERLAPALDVALGKWFTPGLGIRLMYSGLSIKGATQNGSHSNGKVYEASKDLYEQKFDMMNLHGDVLFNLSNLLWGYNEQRFYSFTPYVGLGWMSTWDAPSEHELSANLGLLNSFRLSSVLDLNLDVRNSLVNDRFDGELGGRREEGLLSATVGLTYKFSGHGWSKKRVQVEALSNEELASMRARLAEMTLINDSLRTHLPVPCNVTKTDTIFDKNFVGAPCLVIFPIGKSVLTNDNLVNIGFLAKVLKESKDAIYTVTGYADRTTGSVSLNDRLSKARMEVVYEVLVNKFGVPASQLRKDYKGGVDNLFYNDPRLSRAVIVKAQ